MNKTMQQPIVWIIVAVVALGASAAILYNYDRSENFDPTPADVNLKVTEEATGEGPNSNRPALPNSLTYQEALEMYSERRIQFENCVAQPFVQTYKNGTLVMLDNRGEPTEIRLDGIPIRLYDYEFKVVRLHHPNAPHTISVDCQWLGEDKYNIAELTVQP